MVCTSVCTKKSDMIGEYNFGFKKLYPLKFQDEKASASRGRLGCFVFLWCQTPCEVSISNPVLTVI